MFWTTGDVSDRLRALADATPGRAANKAADLIEDRREALTASGLPPRTLRGIARAPLGLAHADGSLRVEPRQRVRAGLLESRFTLHVDNASARVWPGFDPRGEGLVRARVSYRAEPDASSDEPIDERVTTALAALDVDLPPGRTTASVWLPPPLRPGRHSVCIDLVQSIGGDVVALGLAPVVWTIEALPGDALPDMWDSVMAHQAGKPLPPCGAEGEDAT